MRPVLQELGVRGEMHGLGSFRAVSLGLGLVKGPPGGHETLEVVFLKVELDSRGLLGGGLALVGHLFPVRLVHP